MCMKSRVLNNFYFMLGAGNLHFINHNQQIYLAYSWFFVVVKLRVSDLFPSGL